MPIQGTFQQIIFKICTLNTLFLCFKTPDKFVLVHLENIALISEPCKCDMKASTGKDLHL